MTTGVVMERMTECPLCKGSGCVVCHESGVVKQRNLDRAQEPLPDDDGWSDAALLRLFRMVVVRRRVRKQHRARVQRWLAENEPESRLDALDREHRERGV